MEIYIREYINPDGGKERSRDEELPKGTLTISIVLFLIYCCTSRDSSLRYSMREIRRFAMTCCVESTLGPMGNIRTSRRW